LPGQLSCVIDTLAWPSWSAACRADSPGELTRDARRRTLQENAADDEQRHRATAVVAAWTEQLPEPVTPKL